MKKKKTWLIILAVAVVGALLYYFVFMSTSVPEEYGPVEFEVTLKGDEELVELDIPISEINGLTEVEFTPEETGIKRDDINSLKLKSLVITTNHEDGFEPFDYITITFNSDETETIDVGSMEIKPEDKDEIVIKKGTDGEVPDFKNIKNFRVIVQLNIREGYSIDKPVKIKGEMMLNVMVEENSESDSKSKSK